MYTLKLKVNGQTKCMPIELTPEQEQQVTLFTSALKENANFTGWEKPEDGEYGYYEDEDGTVASIESNDENRELVDHLYDTARIYSHSMVAGEAIRIQLLLRRLRRFAATRRQKPLDMETTGGYSIMYNYSEKCLECGMTGPYLSLGEIVFETEAQAREAMVEFAEELTWYFTHLRERLWTNLEEE